MKVHSRHEALLKEVDMLNTKGMIFFEKLNGFLMILAARHDEPMDGVAVFFFGEANLFRKDLKK